MGKLLSAGISLLLASCAAAPPSEQYGRPVVATAEFPWPKNLQGETVLFVGAHPDDELGVAPLLADACLTRGAGCHFVVVAEANSPGCQLTIGLRDFQECSRLRREEMRASARLVNGTVEFFGYDDLFYSHNSAGVHRVLTEWAAKAGGYEAMISRFENVLRRHRPAVVFALDPRHGSSCSPAHRVTTQLLLTAIARQPTHQRPAVWLEQSDLIDARSEAVAKINKDGGFVGWPETAPWTITYDSSKRLRTGKEAYDYVREVRKTHATQFPDEAAGKVVLDPPATLKKVPLAPVSSLADADYCDRLNLRHPTLDTPEGRKRFGLE